jgi:methyl-accepting chemotaxis protein
LAIEGLAENVNVHMDAIDSCAGGSSGVAKVNAAVNHMDQATPQSAAVVEQTPVAAANEHRPARTARPMAVHGNAAVAAGGESWEEL